MFTHLDLGQILALIKSPEVPVFENRLVPGDYGLPRDGIKPQVYWMNEYLCRLESEKPDLFIFTCQYDTRLFLEILGNSLLWGNKIWRKEDNDIELDLSRIYEPVFVQYYEGINGYNARITDQGDGFNYTCIAPRHRGNGLRWLKYSADMHGSFEFPGNIVNLYKLI